MNTPETPLYKKSQVLYGIDLARKQISKDQQAVIVEGYTDVMACHVSGVTTAVATCGTSFGADHIKVLRRLLMDDDQMRGAVVFTFDGDAAGQKAALRAFEEDQKFVSQTFVAVEPTGLDPCDLRLQHGDAAVRSLVDRRVPLFEFAIRSALARHDLNTAEGRIGALHDAAPIVAKIRDGALRPEYARLLAGWLGMAVASVTKAIGSTKSGAGSSQGPAYSTRGSGRPDTGHVVEREALKCALQQPATVEHWYASVEPSAYTHPAAIAVHEAIGAAGSPSADLDGLAWIDAVLERAADDAVRNTIRELAVEPLPAESSQNERYATSVIARLLEMDAGRRVSEVKGRLQRAEAAGDAQAHTELFTELLALEDYRRSLRTELQGQG